MLTARTWHTSPWQVADKDGNLVPVDERVVRFSVSGAGKFRATANGDPTSLRLFHLPEMDLFSGARHRP